MQPTGNSDTESPRQRFQREPNRLHEFCGDKMGAMMSDARRVAGCVEDKPSETLDQLLSSLSEREVDEVLDGVRAAVAITLAGGLLQPPLFGAKTGP